MIFLRNFYLLIHIMNTHSAYWWETSFIPVAVMAVLLLGPGPAWAHVESGQAGGFFSGLSHPVSGLDHVLAMIAVGVLFALANDGPVPLDLLVYSFEPRSLALWILLAFALGGIAGMLMSSLVMVRLRTSANSLQRQLGRAKAELEKLRTAGLADGE